MQIIIKKNLNKNQTDTGFMKSYQQDRGYWVGILLGYCWIGILLSWDIQQDRGYWVGILHVLGYCWIGILLGWDIQQDRGY